MSDSDSFIEEVTEEVRRDRLFAILKKYAWIPILIVVLAVGGAAYNEYRKATERTAAENLGDAIIAAAGIEDADARAAALGTLATTAGDASVIVKLQEAAVLVEEASNTAALEILDDVAGNSETLQLYQDLAAIKAAILRGSDDAIETRLTKLDALARPGAPFRVIAMEQKAMALIDDGQVDAAVALLIQILDEPDASNALRSRVQQLIVSLGGEVPSQARLISTE